MRKIYKSCKHCGEKYEYMVSAYGMSPRKWNNQHGVTGDYCSKCKDKSIPKIKRWIEDKIADWKNRFRQQKRQQTPQPVPVPVYKMGPVTPCPFPKINFSIFSYESEYGKTEKENKDENSRTNN